MSSSVPWGRGAGEGIGLSGHKNEYKSGVRISNWVEEQCGVEAKGTGNQIADFTVRQESEFLSSAMSSQPERSMRVEPNLGVPGTVLFSHGRTFADKFGASMSQMHYTDPAERTYGAQSNDRVHKSFFYGSKHIDQYVPKTHPNPRMTLTETKRAEWAQQVAPQAPTVRGSSRSNHFPSCNTLACIFALIGSESLLLAWQGPSMYATSSSLAFASK